MRKRHAPFAVVHHDGLRIAALAPAGRSIAHVTNRNVALPELAERFRAKHFVYKACVLMEVEKPVVVHDDAAALLSPVLQRIQRVICKGSHIRALR